MSERAITDPSQHGWVLENGKWVWDASDGAGAGMVISETEPTDKVEGMQWLNPTTGLVLFWDGEKWLQMPGGVHGKDGKQIWDDTNAPDISYTGGDVSVETIRADTVTYSLNTMDSGATTTFDFAENSSHVVYMEQNSTFVFSNVEAGQTGVIIIKQDNSGGKSFTLPDIAKTPKGGAAIVQETGGDSTSILSYSVFNASNVLVNYIADFA